MADKLNLIVHDTDDLQVVSAHMQDAIAQVGDISYLPGERRFVLIFNRFRWETLADRTGTTAKKQKYERVRTGLHFDDVLSARVQGVSRSNKDAVLELLAINFEETDAPAGIVTLTFAGGGAIRLDVECLEGQMHDMSDAWPTKGLPAHALDTPED